MPDRTIQLPTAPGGGINAEVLSAASHSENTDVLKRHGVGQGGKFRVPDSLVKGTRAPGEKPLDDFDKIMGRQEAVEKTFLASVRKSMSDPMGVINGLSPQFAQPLGALMQANPYFQLSNWAKSIDKSFTLTSPLGTGLVPYDLAAPTWLIYPIYTPLRNRIARVTGQGKSHQGKVITQILGSQPGIYSNPSQRMSISELPAGGGLSSWPNQLPASGSQTAVDVNVPYKFFGLTEAVTWLAQFSGQGFDDVAALASLVLLQEFMLGEERAMIGATAFPLAAPGQPTGTARSASTGETALSGVTGGTIRVRVTSINYYGETVSSTVSAPISVAGGQVVDVTLTSPASGMLAQNIYVGTGSGDPGVAGSHLMASAVGGVLYTLQGTIPTGTATPPTSDTGTSASTDYEGIFSILSGHAAANSASGYPADYLAGYYNASVGDTLSVSAIDNALRQVYNGSSASYFADPAEIWCEAADATNLSKDLVVNGNDLNYTIFVQQDEVANVTAGIAVSQFTNPVTRSTVRITVHPYWPQGSAVGMSYSLPQAQTNISNVWENVMVQDYVSINWPVIDVTFRYSLFMYGTLFAPAPQYNFLLQGLQASNEKPYS